MRTHLGIVAAIVIGLLGVSLPCFAGSQNPFKFHIPERAVDELKLMTLTELAGEARRACHHRLTALKSSEKFNEIRAFADAGEYLDQAIRMNHYLRRVGLVIREKQGGQMPAWFDQFSGKKPEDCEAAATAGGWPPKQ